MRENSASTDYPEELLDVFKAAALSVTKLYKTSTAAQSKARIDGYQDCLEDLLTLLDKGVVDVRAVRRWATDRLDGREPIVPTIESEDEVDKADAALTPEPQRTDGDSRSATTSSDTAMRTGSKSPSPSLARTTTTHSTAAAAANPSVATSASSARASPSAGKAAARAKEMAPAAEDINPEYLEPVEVSVPMQGAFTFRSPVAYPPESYLQLANLDLSDKLSGSSDDSSTEQPQHSSSAANNNTSPTSSSSSSPHNAKAAFRVRHTGSSRFGARSTAAARHGRGSTAGQKRKLNVEEIFDLASLGYGKDVFGRGGSSKRPRQA